MWAMIHYNAQLLGQQRDYIADCSTSLRGAATGGQPPSASGRSWRNRSPKGSCPTIRPPWTLWGRFGTHGLLSSILPRIDVTITNVDWRGRCICASLTKVRGSHGKPGYRCRELLLPVVSSMNLKVSLAENIFYPKWRILREELLDIFYRLFIVVSISLGAEDKVISDTSCQINGYR